MDHQSFEARSLEYFGLLFIRQIKVVKQQGIGFGSNSFGDFLAILQDMLKHGLRSHSDVSGSTLGGCVHGTSSNKPRDGVP